ncbi:MAG: hypothetical protein H0V44_06255 [Planctomycetes bacterium]|nr:hypothetical protein [Planctomycetota bacterium]
MNHLALLVALIFPLVGAWSSELPEDAAKAVSAFEKKRRDIEAKASAEVAKEAEALIKALQKLEDRETKAHHSEAALAIKATLEELAGASTSVSTKSAKGNKPWPDFLKEVRVVSQVFEGGDKACGSAAITIGPYAMTCARGLNVVVLVDGKPVIQKTYHDRTDFDKLVKELDALPPGAYVVMALQYDIARDFPDAWVKCLRSCGAKEALTDITAYLLIGAKGLRPGDGIEAVGTPVVQYPSAAK